MSISKLTVAFGVLCGLVTTAAADDYYDDEPRYPMEFVRRPLVLDPSMMEVRLGAETDAVGTGDDRLRTKADFLYSFAPRMQLGLTSAVGAMPTDDFAVNDVAAFFDYNAVPSMNLRIGVYSRVPAEGDPLYGVRFGAPIKIGGKNKTAVRFTPELSIGSGDEKSLSAPLVGELQLASRLAFSVSTGLMLRELEFTDPAIELPVGAGVHLAVTRLFDLNATFTFTDVTESAGRSDRWLLIFIAFRG